MIKVEIIHEDGGIEERPVNTVELSECQTNSEVVYFELSEAKNIRIYIEKQVVDNV